LYGSEDVRRLVSAAKARLSAAGVEPIQADVEAHYQWIERVAAEVTVPKVVPVEMTVSAGTLHYSSVRMTMTDRLDRVLMHRVWGMAVFAVVMAGLFYAIFSLADPVMGATEELVAWMGGLLSGALPEGPIRDLWDDGIVAGVGGVVVFVPQIAILFGFLAILEDSGYLARAAFLMDRLLSKVGLSGKAFVPLLSSFACAIPGIMATRTIENPRQRLATIFVAPFMSCSARLPVYTLLIGTFFAAWGPMAQAGVMFGLYVLGIVAAAATAWVMQRFSAPGGASGFVLELPSYKRPQVSQVIRQVWSNTSKFITRAGTIIFCLSIVLWAMTYYPRLSPQEAEAVRSQIKVGNPPGYGSNPEVLEILQDQALATAQLRQSISGRLGHLLEPAIRPLGYDWKMGVGLISAFAAREVFVSTMGIVYSVGGAEEDPVPLRDAMLADRYADGTRVWTVPVAVSLLVWFVIAMQCMSTLAIVKRETGTWRWPVVMLVYMNAVAYVGALVTYQVLSRVWV
jgi:ferrous iron transport protein B